MIERKDGKDVAPPKKMVKIVEAKKEVIEREDSGPAEDVIMASRKKLLEKMSGKKKDSKL